MSMLCTRTKHAGEYKEDSLLKMRRADPDSSLLFVLPHDSSRRPVRSTELKYHPFLFVATKKSHKYSTSESCALVDGDFQKLFATFHKEPKNIFSKEYFS